MNSEGKYEQFHFRKQKLISSEFIKARLVLKRLQFRIIKSKLEELKMCFKITDAFN